MPFMPNHMPKYILTSLVACTTSSVKSMCKRRRKTSNYDVTKCIVEREVGLFTIPLEISELDDATVDLCTEAKQMNTFTETIRDKLELNF